MYERAIATSGDLGDRWTVALTLVDLGELFADQGEHHAGHQRFAQALGLAREIGYHAGIARGWRRSRGLRPDTASPRVRCAWPA
jgi:hypothetical protein